MAITLQPIPGPVTPLPNNNPATTAFANNYFKVAQGVVSTRERKMLQVVGLIREVKAVRSIDYTQKHKQLRQDAQTFTRGISTPLDLDTAFAAIDWSNGKAADATTPNELSALEAEAKDLRELHEDDLNRMIVLLECQLQE
jgi:hypothetical protein